MKEIYGKYENGKMEFAPNLTLRHRMTRRWRRTSAKSAKLAARLRRLQEQQATNTVSVTVTAGQEAR